MPALSITSLGSGLIFLPTRSWDDTGTGLLSNCLSGIPIPLSCTEIIALSSEKQVVFCAPSIYITVIDTFDTTPPISSHSITSGILGSNNWHITDVDIEITATDNDGGSGVKEIHYILNNEVAVVTEAPSVSLTITTEGLNSLVYWAIDFAGNTDYPKNILGIKIDKTVPEVTNVTASPNPAAVDEEITISASATDLTSGAASVWYSIDGVSWSRMARIGTDNYSATIPSLSVGVYDIQVYARDVAGNTSELEPVSTLLAVYDRDAGFVTGVGWIDSPTGAYTADPGLAGRANFGFVSRYVRNVIVPTGNTQFVFQAGGLNFNSTSYEWLVIAGARAQYKGVGRLNGADGYGFMLTAIDGSVDGGGEVDRFRIKIWDAEGSIVYDNQIGASDSADPATALGGGSIMIHTPPAGTGGGNKK